MNYEFLLDGYNTANQKVLNMENRTIDHGCYLEYNIRKETVFTIEDQLSEEDKLHIIDYHTDGLGTYMLDLIDKYWECRENGELKLDTWGSIDGRSLRGFIRKYDTRKELRTYKSYPTYYMFHTEFRLNKDHMTPATEYGHKMLYDGKNVINQWFHDLLGQLYKEEKEYFKENDPVQIKYNKIIELVDEIGRGMVCQNEDINDIYWNNKRDGLTDEYLDQIIQSLENIKIYIKDNLYDLKNGGK